jgi:hypothetical protein
MQSSNSIPFNFYDHIAVLFPGAIFLSYLIFISNKIFPITIELIIKLNKFSSTLLILAILVASFILGHIVYSISKFSFDNALFSKGKQVDKFLDYSHVKQSEIIEQVEKIYGEKIGEELRFNLQKYKNGRIDGAKFGLKNYCYALVERKEAKHDVFIALADFLRGTAFLIFAGAIYINGAELYYYLTNQSTISDLLKIIGFSVIPLLSSYLLFKRSIRMRKAADSIIYSQFLFDAKNIKI